MWDQETFKKWLPIDGQQYQTPYGVYTARLVKDVEDNLPDRSLCYLFQLTCPDAKDRTMTVRVYAEYFSAEERRRKALGIIAMRIRNTDEAEIDVNLQEED